MSQANTTEVSSWPFTKLQVTVTSCLVLSLTALGVVSGLLLKSRWNKSHKRLPPGPWGLPIIGAVFRLGANPHLSLTKMADKYGDIFSLRIGARLVVVLNGADVIREGLVKRSAFLAGRPPLFSLQIVSGGGHGLAFVGYSRTWAVLRKVCEKAVHHYVNSDVLHAKIETESQRMVDYFCKQNGKPLNALNGIHFATANVILGLLFDTNFNYDNDDLLQILEDEAAFQDTIGLANAVDFFPWLRFFTPSRTTKRLVALATKILNLMRKLYRINKESYRTGRIRCLADSLMKTAEENNEKGKIEKSEEQQVILSDKDLVHTLFDMFGAGFDTAALTLHWAAAYLIVYPDIQQKLHEELDRALPRDRPPSIKDKEKLPFLEATIYELLRITSLLPESIPHSTTADVVFAGYTIPKHTIVFVNLWSANHDPKAWKDPDVFNPARFLDEKGHVIDPKLIPSFLPFATGRRRCLGDSLAIMELVSFLGALLQNFRFTQEGLEPSQQGIDLTPKFGIGLAIKPFLMRLVQRETKDEK